MEKKSSSVLGYVHWLIGIAIMYSGNLITPTAPLTDMGAKALMIFVGMVYLWCTVNPIGGSLLALFAISLAGYASFTEVLSTGIGDSTFLQVFYACILFCSAIVSGMPKYISHGIFKSTEKLINGRPMVLVFILMASSAVISALTSIIPTILMFWAICYAIIDELKLEKKDRYSMLLVFSSFMGSMLGNAWLPFKGATVIIISAYTKVAEQPIPYGSYMIINIILSVLIMVLFCLSVKWIFRMDLSKVSNIDASMLTREKLPPMSVSVKAHIFAILAFMILVLYSTTAPKTAFGVAFLSGIGVHGISVLLLILLLAIKDDGKPSLKIAQTMKELPWGALFMVMAAVYMAGVLKNKDVTGVIPWLKTVLNPVLGGHTEFVFAMLIVALAMVLTCFFHNGALGNMLMPILFALASANGYNGVAIAAIMTMAINMAYLAPSASNYAPMLHGNKEYISLKDIWTYGLYFEILTFIVFMFLGLPMAKFMM